MSEPQNSDLLWYLAGAFSIGVGVLGLFFPRSGNIIEVLKEISQERHSPKPRKKARAH